MPFSVLTKNLNWEMVTKNLLLKDRMGLRMKNFNFVGVNWEIQFLRGVHEKPIYRGDLPKKGAWAVSWFNGVGGSQKKGGGIFDSGEGLISQW